jgi:FAD/FMN-containing dehydrogenase
MSGSASLNDLLGRFRAIVGPPGILTENADMAPFETDWRGIFKGKALCLLQPASAAEVARIVALCHEEAVELVPQGGNTGLAGGATPDASGRQVLLSLRRLNRIRAIDPVGMTIAAEAGCILKTAQDAAAEQGRLLPVSLAAEGSATIGGIVSTNAGGVNVLRYGMTRSLVLGLEVVLPDGTLVDGMRQLRKDNAGYDWKQLFIGSEGSLGIVTAAIMRLVPQPAHAITALMAVPGPDAAIVLLGRCRERLGDQISAFELLSNLSMRLVARHGGRVCPIDIGESWFVLIEAASCLPGLRDAAEAMLAGALADGVVQDGVIAESGAQAAQLWALREHVTEAEAREGRSVKHDVSVPLDAIPRFLVDADCAIEGGAPGARVNGFGHLGDGNIHYNVLIDDRHEVAAINKLVHDVVARHGGSISAEHGIGQYRVAELEQYRGSAELDLTRTIKRAIDPDNRLNPGKVIRRPQATAG